MNTFLTAAGSDPSGGAGIQADIKTASAFGLYSMSVITAVTIQNTAGVKGVHEIPSETVYDQLEAVFSDIYPDCMKIGMCVNSEIIDAVASIMDKYNPKNTVLDTILISSSGRKLISDEAAKDMKSKLFPRVDIITPNVPEAEWLTGLRIVSENDMRKAAAALRSEFGCNVFIKGGHLNGCDIFYDGSFFEFPHILVDNPNTHGTGCTLSSALACALGKGSSPKEAAREAVSYVFGAISDGLDLGKGIGPLNHLYPFKNFYDH